MDSEGRLQFPKLSSVNYRSWSFTIKAVLASKDLIQYINTRVNNLISSKAIKLTPSPETPAQEGELLASPELSLVDTTVAIAKATKELLLSDAKAQALIIVQLSVNQLSFVATATTAYDQ